MGVIDDKCTCGDDTLCEHSCPFADEFDEHPDPEYCMCCAVCEAECAMDI